MPMKMYSVQNSSWTLREEKCGEMMEREPYVIDTWFDSGSATYAATHYPFNGAKEPDINWIIQKRRSPVPVS